MYYGFNEKFVWAHIGLDHLTALGSDPCDKSEDVDLSLCSHHVQHSIYHDEGPCPANTRTETNRRKSVTGNRKPSQKLLRNSTVQKFGVYNNNVLNVFESLLISPRLYLFDQNYSTIFLYYYNLK